MFRWFRGKNNNVSPFLVKKWALTALFGKVLETILEDTKHDKSRLTYVTFFYMNFIVTILAFAAVISGPIRMKNLIKHVNTIATVDKCLGTQYSHVIDIKIFIAASLMLVLLIVLFIRDYFIFTSYNAKFFRLLSRATFHIMNFLMMNLYLQMVYTFITIRARFQSINDALTLVTCQWSAELETFLPKSIKICAVSENDSVMDKTPSIIVRRSITVYSRLVVSPGVALQRIAILRDSLCDVVNCLSRDCGPPLIITFLSTLGNFVVFVYFMFFFVSAAVGIRNKVLTSFNSGPWIVMHTVVMISLIDPCHRTI